jgi:hypothetical protein
MTKTLADLLRLFILLTLSILALYSIPAHAPAHKTPLIAKQATQENLVTVTEEFVSNRQQTSF